MSILQKVSNRKTLKCKFNKLTRAKLPIDPLHPAHYIAMGMFEIIRGHYYLPLSASYNYLRT